MRTQRTLLALMLAVGLAGCGASETAVDASPPADTSPAPDAALVDGGTLCPGAELASALENGRMQTGAAAASAAVLLTGRCLWTGAAGVSDVPAGTPAVPGDRFRIGSITKTFTAAVVLQLVEEGSVALSDPIAAHVPGVLNGDTITVEHLLRHTSGLYNYTDFEFFGRATEEWTPQEILDYANARSPDFAPGTSWEYSNTNYIVLGMLIENVTGDSYHAQVRARLLGPLGLDDTFLEGPEAGEFVRGYVHSGDTYVDVRDGIHPSAAWAAGAIVSTARDVTAWGAALLGGDALSPALLAEMTTPTTLPDGTMVGYGLGMGIGTSAFGPVQGHGGAIHGFRADFLWFPDDQAAFAVLLNDSDADPQLIEIDLVTIVLQ